MKNPLVEAAAILLPLLTSAAWDVVSNLLSQFWRSAAMFSVVGQLRASSYQASALVLLVANMP